MTADDPLDLAFLMRDDISDVDFVIPATTPGTVVDWQTLADADAPAAWNALREWVEWFTVRYDIPVSTVPACWFRHSHLVDELSALYAAHLVAFDASDTGFGPIRWHERLSEARPRLGLAYYSQCSDGHRSHAPRSWTNAVDERAWDEWIDQPHT
jgi:hypothetical protein